MYKDIFEELSFKFRDLSTLKPDNIRRTNIFNNLINDDTAHDFNPSRYSFYIQFMQGLENPELMKKIIYENKLIKSSKQEESKIIENIVNKINTLYYADPMSPDYLIEKKKIITEEDAKIQDKLNKIVSTEYNGSENIDKIKNIVKDTFVTTMTGGADDIITGDNYQTIQQQQLINNNIINRNIEDIDDIDNKINKDIDDKIEINKKRDNDNASKLKQKYIDNSLLRKYNDKLDGLLKNNEGDSNTTKVNKIRDLINDIDNDEFKSIKNLEISKEDKLVFIGITFLLRIISLALIEWSLNTNFVLNFTQAYLLYLTIYILLLLLIIAIVNITYNLPLIETYSSDNIFVKMASTLYYFYLMPGNRMASAYRLIAHILLLGVLTTIAILIKLSDNNDNTNINYDYAKKKKIKTTLNNFTLILWIFSSIIALKF